jgi:hypothetical protein
VNDVKEICALALDVPAPPARTADEALAVARRSVRRRHRWAAAGSAALVLAMAGSATMVLVGNDPGPTRDVGSSAAVGSAVVKAAAAPTVSGATPAAPSWQDVQHNGGRVSAALARAVPAGLSATREYPDGTATWVALPQSAQPGSYFATTPLIVSAGRRQGLLSADIVRDGVPAPDDLCDAATAARLDQYIGPTTGCHVVTVDGVAIRVSTGVTVQLGQFNLAVRMLDGGFLTVVSAQGRYSFDADTANLPPDAVTHNPSGQPAAPPLIQPALSLDQVAELAAGPAMLP